MRLSRSDSFGKRRKDKKPGGSRTRKKHKRLDAICEETYTRNHSGVKKEESIEANVEPNETELRRSSRVRRAPVVLDASPAPPKKRRKINRKGELSSVDRAKRGVQVKSETLASTVGSLKAESSSWSSRLRTRGKCVSFKERKNRDSTSKGKRKLFVDFDEDTEESGLGIEQADSKEIEQTDDKEVEFTDRISDAEKLEAAEVPSVPENEDQENDLGGGIGDDEQVNQEGVLGLRNEGNLLLLKNANEHIKVDRLEDNLGLPKPDEKEDLEVQSSAKLEETRRDDGAQTLECDILPGNQACVTGEVLSNAIEFHAATGDACQAKDGGAHDNPLEDAVYEKLNNNKTNHASDCTVRPVRIKEGRRCGLCGGGTDGKPPKRLVQDGTVSDNEAYSGGSASEETNYDLWDGFGDERGWLGRLLGPINDRFGIAGIWVHQQCAVWSPEVYFAGLGCLKNVRAALCRGRALKCSRCGRPGATIGCRVDRCPKTYHLPCARDRGSIFDHRKFLIACRDHRHLFQPHGSQYIHRLRKLKVKKMKLDMRKMSNDALRKDIEAEEKWLENCGEDEEFLKRESKRLHRDLLRIAPVYIGGGNCDSGMQFQGWESVAGLQDVIRCMKEVVILPLLYPEFFSNIGLTPPRGVLLHGHPGTGKTLVVRALIGSCARGDKKIAYFARKGADCLGKYVGDAERQLRLLFQVAEKSQPSIIFFDEIDGLAPCRTRRQDQTHSSVVSTLLALMDGLKSRGSVVVIGATNRPDAIDPALRRPGRFDREIYFPLPSVKDREAILSLHTQKWPKPINGSLLKWVAKQTVGFAGADLQALCTQAAILALRRSFPLQEILSRSREKALPNKLPPLPSFTVEERDWLDAISSAPPPCSRREAGIAANDMVSSPLASHLIPCLLQPLIKLLISLSSDDHVWLPPSLSKAAMLIRNLITSALDKKKVQCDKWWSNVDDFLQEADILLEIEDNLSGATNLTEDATGNLNTLEDIADDGYLKFKPFKAQQVGACPGLLHNFVNGPGKKPGFRVLISGEPRSGQRHLASCLLHCFLGNVENRKLDLAAMSQEGHGDVVQGLTQILMRCANLQPCLIFLPRIDLWAVETQYQSCEGPSDLPPSKCTEAGDFTQILETKDAIKTASYLWNSFIDQVESLSVCTSLMVLATSEVPYTDLPCRIRQFFSSEMLNNSLSSFLKDSVPRFVVQIDGSLNDVVIETSAAKFSKNLIQCFIHLVHLQNHNQSYSSDEKTICEGFEGNIDPSHESLYPRTETRHVSRTPVAPVTPVTLRNPVKGKPNLIIAISTFGYQILRFPHFAELSWFTSKLREGPCTHVSGPWKGWPFNSCIVRPVNIQERVAATCSSNITRSKEKSSLVRGLTAIGLKAYRGEYASLREVSLDVRKVLELLVGCINDKIQAGKDQYKFFRLLSQVAYFEDMVSSWTYTLRSFEVDAQVLEGSQVHAGTGSLNNSICKYNLLDGDGCEQNIFDDTLDESNILQQETDAKMIECPDLRANGDLSSPKRGDGVAVLVQETSKEGLLDHSALDGPMQNGIDPETHLEVDSEDQNEVGSHCGCIEDSNGLVQKTHALSENVASGLDDKSGTALSDNEKLCNNLSIGGGSHLESSTGNSSGCSAKTSVNRANGSGIVCVYYCCSHCMVNLRQLLLKVLKHEWELKGSNLTVEDFHDFASSLSASLQSAVRKLLATESPSQGCDDEVLECNKSKYFQCPEACTSLYRSSGKRLMPSHCSCHSRADSIPELSKKSRHGYELKFIFRDGVLAPLDTDHDSSFHCKFEKLCLCSLVDCIAMRKSL